MAQSVGFSAPVITEMPELAPGTGRWPGRDHCRPLRPVGRPGGRLDLIAATGPSNTLTFYWQTIGTQPWNEEVVAGPGTSLMPPSVAWVGDSSMIVARANGATALAFSQVIGSAAWYQQVVSGHATVGGPLSITKLIERRG